MDLQDLNMIFQVIFVDATNNDITLTMPVLDSQGLWFRIKRLDTSGHTVILNARVPQQTIGGQLSCEINVEPTLSLVSFDGKWHFL